MGSRYAGAPWRDMTSFDGTILRGRYRVVPRTLSFVTHGDEVLLLRGAEGKRHFAGQHNGVGGHVEANEDVYAAALREIREETGLDLDDLELRGIANVPVQVTGETGTAGVLLFVFRGESATRQVRASDEGEIFWATRGEVEELDLVEDLPLLLPLVLDAPPDAPPFFAHHDRDEAGHLVVRFSP